MSNAINPPANSRAIYLAREGLERALEQYERRNYQPALTHLETCGAVLDTAKKQMLALVDTVRPHDLCRTLSESEIADAEARANA